MTNVDLLLKKLAFVDTCVRELRTLSKPDELETNVKERRFVEHTLQVCLQAVQDVASHIVSHERLGEPRTNQHLFLLLHTAGWLDEPLTDALRAAIGFRNVLVHGYTAVDPRHRPGHLGQSLRGHRSIRRDRSHEAGPAFRRKRRAMIFG